MGRPVVEDGEVVERFFMTSKLIICLLDTGVSRIEISTLQLVSFVSVCYSPNLKSHGKNKLVIVNYHTIVLQITDSSFTVHTK